MVTVTVTVTVKVMVMVSVTVTQTRKKSQACKQCLRTIFEKIVDIFGSATIFLKFLPINVHKPALLSTINVFLLENIWYNGKYCNFRHFCMLRTIWFCRHFLTPKIGLRTKINFFHVWSMDGSIGWTPSLFPVPQ